MKSLSKSLLVASLLLTFGLCHSSHALSGSGQPGGQTIKCSSDNGSRNWCNADTRGGVRLNRQISGSPCTQGQTWGWENRGIWVDRGCRAEFIIGAGGNWGGNNSGQTITCSSDNGGRNYCNVNTSGGVRLVQQRSGSPCTQGQTWGWDNRGIWVDRGCRADFVVGSGGNWGGGGGGGQTQTITCSSDDGRRNFCNVDTRGGVQMTRQRSGSPCTQGQTWGWDNRGIWVDRGCRADFVVGRGNWGSGPTGNLNPGGPRPGTITCSSNDGRRNWCSIPNVNPNNVVMTRQISGTRCSRGDTWGVDARGLWVDRGCRAEFGFR